jgi:hypothetical protein
LMTLCWYDVGKACRMSGGIASFLRLLSGQARGYLVEEGVLPARPRDSLVRRFLQKDQAVRCSSPSMPTGECGARWTSRPPWPKSGRPRSRVAQVGDPAGAVSWAMSGPRASLGRGWHDRRPRSPTWRRRGRVVGQVVRGLPVPSPDRSSARE